MPRIGVVFVERPYNRNSVAVLTGAIEVSPVAEDVAVTFCRDRRPLGRIPTGTDIVVLAWSFHTADVGEVAELVRAVRAERAGRTALLVAGGPHPSGDPEGTLGLGFDFVVAGEGEIAFPLLLKRLAEGRSPTDVPGLGWLENGAVRRNPRGRSFDLDAFPPFAPRTGRNAQFEISRGCPWACRFCQVSSLMGSRVRHRSVDALAAHAATARANGLRDLRFLAPDGLAYGSPDGKSPAPERLEALLRAAASIFGKEHVFLGCFPAEARPETLTRETVDLVKHLTATDTLVFGCQAGSDRMLERMHRGHDLAAVFRAARLVLDSGMKVIVDFIAGLPGEDDADRAAFRDVVSRLAAMGAVVHTHAFMPLPGTALWGADVRPVDPETAALLERLTGMGRHMGRWRRQQDIARRTVARRGDFQKPS